VDTNAKEEREFLEPYREQILKCSKCGFCQAVCPIFLLTLRPAFNTRGKMLILKAVMERDLQFSQDLAETFYLCTTCQACSYLCPSGVKGDEIIQAARRILYDQDLTPRTLLAIQQNIYQSGNVFASPREERVEIYPSPLRNLAKSGSFKQKAETLLFMGCLPSYMDMKIVPSFISLMDKAKVDYTCLGNNELCCGFPLYLMGADDFKNQAEHLAERIKQTGAKEIVTPCAGCYKTFKRLYPKVAVDLDIKIYHSVQYVNRLIEQGRLKVRQNFTKKVTYHDPCDLGRACGIYEEPRAIINSIPGVEFVEIEKNRENALCCGAGGGMSAFNPDLAIEMSAMRIQQAIATGADIVTSACPSCKDNLRKGTRKLPKEIRKKIKVMDVMELIANALK
jgi:Fe-S oxidoreductase